MALGAGERGELIENRWRLAQRLGAGAFGEVFLATDIETGEQVAVKMEKAAAKHPQLNYEQKVYKWLNASSAGGRGGRVPGVPTRRYFGRHGDCNVLVLDRLGPSLEDRLTECGRRLSLKSVLMVANQALRRLEYVHGRLFLHRDIKPDNALMGVGNESHVLYLVDFGLAKRYKDHRTHVHIPYRDGKHLTGTARYASVSTHEGVEQCRRDDLESLGYVLVYLAHGALPWQGIRAANKKQKYARILEKKRATTAAELCHDLPHQFVDYFHYVRELEFEDRPDYSYLRSLFRKAFEKKGYVDDGIFDWMEAPRGASKRAFTHRRR
jgi:serine/threonine protein kinase